MIFEPCITIGWRISVKPSPILILYCGGDIEAAVAAANDALDNASVQHVRVVRGAFPAGSQLMFAGDEKHRPQLPGPVLPAGVP